MRLLIVLIFLISGLAYSKEAGFTQEDRKRLIRLETTLKTFMEQVDKRFEQTDKRISELREDMNRRFEQVDKRFEQVYTFLWILAGIFTTLTVSVIAFAWWDRRTIISETKRRTIEELERETKPEKLRKVIAALIELAEEDERVAKILKKEGLI